MKSRRSLGYRTARLLSLERWTRPFTLGWVLIASFRAYPSSCQTFSQSLTGDSLWSWTAQSTRILDIAVTPDGRHLVAVGLSNDPVQPRPRSEEDLLSGPAGDGADSVGSTGVEGVREKTRRVLVYDLIKGKAVGWVGLAPW